MKRIVAIVMMIAVMLSSVCGTAETQGRSEVAGMYEEYCEKLLESLCDLYDMSAKYGGEFDDDYVELTYNYYTLWMAVKDVYYKEMQFDIKDMVGSGKVFGINKDAYSGWSLVKRAVEEKWTKYISGETDKAEFMGMLTDLILEQINAGEKAKNEAENLLKK